MPEFLRTGVHRIIYKAKNFQIGKSVSAKIWSPTLDPSPPLSLFEIGDGLYYLDFDFDSEGTWVGKFFEDGVETTFGVFRVDNQLPLLKEDVQLLIQLAKGRWKIENNQLIFYTTDGITEICRFDLRDKYGRPCEENVYDRIPI